MPINEEDPTNVKPTALKLNADEPSKERLTPKGAGGGAGGLSKIKLTGGKSPPSPTPSPPSGQPVPAKLLKLNEFAKNCSQPDSSESNCDFVKKFEEYQSAPVSSVSHSVDQSKSPRGKQSETPAAVVKRTGPTATVKGGSGSGNGSKGRLEKERAREEEREKEKKEKSKEKPTKKVEKSKEAGLKKNERESTTKGAKSKEQQQQQQRGPTKHSKERKRASKSDKGKSKKKK